MTEQTEGFESTHRFRPITVFAGSLLAASGFVYYALTRLNITILLPEVAKSIGVNQLAVAGLISTSTLFGIAIFSFVFGGLADRVGMWKIMVVGLLTMGLFTTLTAYATTVGLMLLARFTVGLSEGLYQPSYYALVGYVFSRRRGLAMGLFSGLFALGIAINPPLTLYFYGLANGSWSVCFEYMGILGFALGLAALAVSRYIRILEPPSRTTSTSGHTGTVWYRDWRLLFIVVAMSSLGLTQYAYLGLMPTYLRVYQHMPQETVAKIISLSGWSSFILGLVGGFASDRLGRLKIIGVYGLANLLVSYPLFTYSTNLASSLILSSLFQGFHGSLIPLGMALTQDFSRKNNLAANSGVTLGSTFITGGFSGWITGWLGGALGFWAVSLMFLLSAGITLLCFLVTGSRSRDVMHNTST